MDKQGSADRAHEQWLDERSDFLTYLNLWHWFERQRENLTRSALRRALGKHFLSNNRMREWLALHRQLLLAARGLGLTLNREPADYSAVHRALLAGSLSLIGNHDERGEYLGPRNLRFRIFPGSSLAERRPRWMVAAEIVETRRVYARTVATVEARWIEEAAPHLVKRTQREPHWSLARGEALAYETVTLYGLMLAEKRRVSLKRFDKAAARQLFLIDGLVHGAIKRPADFLTHNLELAAAIRDEEDKGRRRDLLKSEAEIAALYETRLPERLTTVRDLERWLRKAPDAAVAELFFTREQLSADDTVRYAVSDFPAEITMRGHDFPLRYRFAPGAADDGISVEAPIGLVEALVPQALAWSVPGMLEGVCEQWLRSLPKAHRRKITPIPDAVRAVLPTLRQPSIYRQGRFEVSLAEAVAHEFGLRIRAEDWNLERIDPHWLVNVKVIDTDGQVIEQGRDVEALRARFAAAGAKRLEDEQRAEHESDGLLDFPDRPVTGTQVIGSGAESVVAYPTLVDEGDSVALRNLPSADAQAAANRAGYARLALLKLGQTARYLKKQIAADKPLGVLFAPLGGAELFRDELLKATAWQCFFEGEALPEDAAAFAARLDARRGSLAETLERLRGQLRDILSLRLELIRELDAATSPAFAESVSDIRGQLEALVGSDVLTVTPGERLADLPRYLEAARHRLKNLQGKVQRDQQLVAELRGFRERLDALGTELGRDSSDWQALRFLLEEVRVGLFAERLGVREKASTKRFDRALQTLEREHGLI